MNSSSSSPPTSTDRWTTETRTRFDVHLLECDGCENYLQQFRATVDTVGKIDQETIDPAFRDRLLNAFRDFR